MVGRMTVASLLFVLVFASAASAGPPPFARGGSNKLSIPQARWGSGCRVAHCRLQSRFLPTRRPCRCG